MFRHTQTSFVGIAICALFAVAAPCDAGTIIKLSLSGDSAADIEFAGGVAGLLSTADDLVGSSTGDQNTAVEYANFLEAFATDIDTPDASFTLDSLTATGPATVIGGVFLFQSFAGGTLSLYDPANTLLLSGSLSTSVLAGTLGPPGTGGVFSTNFAVVTGGTLAPYIDPTSLSLSVALADINGGAGFTISPLVPPPPPLPPGIAFGTLDAFTADASLNIAGDFSGIPEPASVVLYLIGGAIGLIARLRVRR